MRVFKTHYRPVDEGVYCKPIGGKVHVVTDSVADITCRVCMFAYLARQAPWARAFLDGLRKVDTALKRGLRTKPKWNGDITPEQIEDFQRLQNALAERIPVTSPADSDAPVERLGRSFRTLLNQQGVAQEAVRKFLPKAETPFTAVEVVVDYSRAATQPVDVEERQVAENSGNAGQIGLKSSGGFE